MQLLVIERNLVSILGALIAAIRGRLGRQPASAASISSAATRSASRARHSNVILDGETFQANDDEPIVLRPTAPVPFLRLAA